MTSQTSCPPPPPPSWPAAVVVAISSVLFSPVSPAPLVGEGGGGGVRARAVVSDWLALRCKLARQHLATTMHHHHQASGAPGPKRQLDVSSILGYSCATRQQQSTI